MADFFSGLQNGSIRRPDAKFGPGPLPTADVLAGGPAGINGNPDGVYNDAGGLLSGIDKYAGPKEGRMGSDKQYQQIPHRMQHIIHMLHLPYADKRHHELVPMSHAVDQGDIAFVINTNRIQGLLYNELIQRDAGIAKAQMPSRNAFANLVTVNYLLAGLQRLRQDDSIAPHGPWKSLALDLSYNPADTAEARTIAVLRLLRERFLPYGICAGSEHQGGKHETGLAPVQSAANHITSMTIDGQNRDLVNLWRRIDVSAGDQLIFRLEFLPTQAYTLNHYYKGTVHQTFPELVWCWQLVPDIFRMAYDNTKYEGLPRYDCPCVRSYDYRLHGFWRIGQCFQHRGHCDVNVEHYSNDRCFLSGQLLQITFAPVWSEFESLAKVLKTDGRAGVSTAAARVVQRALQGVGPRRTRLMPAAQSLNRRTGSLLGGNAQAKGSLSAVPRTFASGLSSVGVLEGLGSVSSFVGNVVQPEHSATGQAVNDLFASMHERPLQSAGETDESAPVAQAQLTSASSQVMDTEMQRSQGQPLTQTSSAIESTLVDKSSEQRPKGRAPKKVPVVKSVVTNAKIADIDP